MFSKAWGRLVRMNPNYFTPHSHFDIISILISSCLCVCIFSPPNRKRQGLPKAKHHRRKRLHQTKQPSRTPTIMPLAIKRRPQRRQRPQRPSLGRRTKSRTPGIRRCSNASASCRPICAASPAQTTVIPMPLRGRAFERLLRSGRRHRRSAHRRRHRIS